MKPKRAKMPPKEIKKSPAHPLSQRVTAPPRPKKRRAIVDDLKARKMLLVTYRHLKNKGGWRAVAKRFGLSSPGRAQFMAEGKRPICQRMKDVVRMTKKTFMRRFIKKVAVPFLQSRTVSPTRRYLRGGRHAEELK